MTIESLTRTPKEGTDRFKVFKAIAEDNIPISDTRAIARETGLSRKKVTAARSNLREDGYLPKPTKELTRLTQHIQAATVFPLVKEYREIGLSLREIQLAVKIEKGTELSYESAHSAVGYNTKVGNVRRLSREESDDIKRDVNMLTPEEISENVAAILELRKKLLENGLPLPTNRLEWKTAINQILDLSESHLNPYSIEAMNLSNRVKEKLIASGVREIGDFFSVSPQELEDGWIGEKEDLKRIVKLILDYLGRGNGSNVESNQSLFLHITDAICYRYSTPKTKVPMPNRTQLYQAAYENLMSLYPNA